MAFRPSMIECKGILCGLRIRPRTIGLNREGAGAGGKAVPRMPAGSAFRQAVEPRLLRRSTWRHETLAPTDRLPAPRAHRSQHVLCARRRRPSRVVSPLVEPPSSFLAIAVRSKPAPLPTVQPTRPEARGAAPTPPILASQPLASTLATIPSTPVTRTVA